MSAPALKIERLSKSFGGIRAVHNLSIEIERGTITAIIGPNGSGKTTLVNLLTGTIAFDAGMVVVAGGRLGAIEPADAPSLGITRTFQNIRLFEQMTVEDNLLVVLTERNLWGALFEHHHDAHRAEALRLLERVGLKEKRHVPASNLSYGQRKLLEITRALAMKMEIVLLDEPSAGLFPEMIKVVSGAIKELKQEGKTVVLIEHNMELIRALSDRIIILDGGELLSEGEPEKVLARRDVIEAYLGE